MKILIVGGGLIGLTSAYCLKTHGHEVTVLDRQEGPGLETSFANGAILTPSMPDPWNSPGCWRTLLGSLVRSDSPLQLRLGALPSLAGWGMRFLKSSSATAYERHTLDNLRLALYSLQQMDSLRRQTGIEYGRQARGTLRVFRDAGSLERAQARAASLAAEGLSYRRLSPEETVALEPALAPIAGQLAGSIHYASDETGDAYQFCAALAERLQALGVELRFRTEVRAVESRGGQVTRVLAGAERLRADHYVVAAASYSTPLLRPLGIDLPVRPAKGYSITVAQTSSLQIPVIDDHLHAVVSPLPGALRVAGTAEFAGFDRSLPPARIENLVTLLRQVLPQTRFDASAVKPWCGLRAMSADGVPLIGATSLSNLWVNTGHGHLGWTMAAGSAQLLAELMSGKATSLDPRPYSLRGVG